jgi:peptide-methionine (S)-S-oxide reductase
MKFTVILSAIAFAISVGACNGNPSNTSTSEASPAAQEKASKPKADLSKLKRATFAGGCFWCEEAVFESIKGVGEVISGYAGGKTDNPTYEGVGTGATGHAEAVEIYYDSAVVNFPALVDVYLASIDPYQVNGQGPDHGSQYRSIIFYRNDIEKAIAQQKIAALDRPSDVAVEVVAFTRFWEAEAYHQDYVPNHPENPYVQHESIPRLKRTQAKVKSWVAEGKWAK